MRTPASSKIRPGFSVLAICSLATLTLCRQFLDVGGAINRRSRAPGMLKEIWKTPFPTNSGNGSTQESGPTWRWSNRSFAPVCKARTESWVSFN